jgi:hypothetical protein
MVGNQEGIRSLRFARRSDAIQVLDQSLQSHASFSPLDPKVAQTLEVALRLNPEGISESGSKQRAI